MKLPRRKVVGISVPLKMSKMRTRALLECGHIAFYTSRQHPKEMACRDCARAELHVRALANYRGWQHIVDVMADNLRIEHDLEGLAALGEEL